MTLALARGFLGGSRCSAASTAVSQLRLNTFRTSACANATLWATQLHDLRLVVAVGGSSQSGLVKDRDCPGRKNVCYGQDLENVHPEEGDPPRGDYRVSVRLEKLGGAEGTLVRQARFAVQTGLTQQTGLSSL